MTGFDVAEPQPLWLSLQHTLPSGGTVDALAEFPVGLVGAAGTLVVIALSSPVIIFALAELEIADLAVSIADSAGPPFL